MCTLWPLLWSVCKGTFKAKLHVYLQGADLLFQSLLHFCHLLQRMFISSSRAALCEPRSTTFITLANKQSCNWCFEDSTEKECEISSTLQDWQTAQSNATAEKLDNCHLCWLNRWFYSSLFACKAKMLSYLICLRCSSLQHDGNNWQEDKYKGMRTELHFACVSLNMFIQDSLPDRVGMESVGAAQDVRERFSWMIC